MENNPLVSILIVAYNPGEYLRNTLRSCIDQTYGNIEILILDNYSTEDIRQYFPTDSGKLEKIRLIKSQENLGPYRCTMKPMKNISSIFSMRKITILSIPLSCFEITPDFAMIRHKLSICVMPIHSKISSVSERKQYTISKNLSLSTLSKKLVPTIAIVGIPSVGKISEERILSTLLPMQRWQSAGKSREKSHIRYSIFSGLVHGSIRLSEFHFG